MITSLYIKNVAVVKELNLDLSDGFSTLTGETGAGKSVIMDSIGILLGSRTVKGKIRNGEKEAIIRACFDTLPADLIERLSELGFDCREGLIFQRTFTSDGRSNFKLNGQTVTLGIAKEIGIHLITIHGQNDNQKLMQKSEHLGILDLYADILVSKKEYQEIYAKYKILKEELTSLKTNAAEKARMFDVYLFQAKEIDSLHLKSGEEEALLSEEKRLANIEKIQKHTKFTYHVIKGSEKSVCALLDKASSSISHLSEIIEDASELNDKLIQIRYELDDIADSVSSWGEDGEESVDKKLDKIGSRLNSIAKLKRKYGNSIDEILEFRKKIAIILNEMENSDELIEKTEAKLKDISAVLEEKAACLTKARKKAALSLQKSIMNELSFLEMPKVRFIIDIKPLHEIGINGKDEVEFLISTNLGQDPMPMIKIASGGELSRIMLAIKSILLDKDGASTVIFDEIDTGISGKTSRKVGIKLKEIAKHMQVICVTHSAQIASLSDNHYLIYKHDINGATQTEVQLLDNISRVNEVARILGGLNVTESQLTAAKEMIEEGKTL